MFSKESRKVIANTVFDQVEAAGYTAHSKHTVFGKVYASLEIDYPESDQLSEYDLELLTIAITRDFIR